MTIKYFLRLFNPPLPCYNGKEVRKMERRDNYRIQADQAKQRFLGYDQEQLIRKLGLEADDTYLYTSLFRQSYRIHRQTGSIQRLSGDAWLDGNSFGEVMTLLDLVCDSREDRFVKGRWKNMLSFGLMFHQNLLEDSPDPWAARFEQNPAELERACLALGGTKLPQGDVCYAIEVFDGLPVAIQLWLGDEEFPSSLRFQWDENATMYLKYETMYYARSLLMQLILENM